MKLRFLAKSFPIGSFNNLEQDSLANPDSGILQVAQAAIAKAEFLSCVSYENSIEYCQAELLYYKAIAHQECKLLLVQHTINTINTSFIAFDTEQVRGYYGFEYSNAGRSGRRRSRR